ncbi:hypothetical protein FE392_03005 [Xenorhabdus sp. 12]|uniref:Uncharacterized protein n=1 Tax=Xenorhabdus santafensis TaxID=2582833 RepID=A0ABU4S512_9GAMM|nr:hypothetical protein [Xenorhabdus sp. 12]MDX7986306.1 hypothetical protein [Xenorhabdus sp. 12]
MDAKIVWHTWRKILRDEVLQRQLFDRQWQAQACDAFTLEEQEVIAAYAEDIDRAKWFIENYQFRLVNSFINALENGAPLTLRALLNSGVEIPQLSREFLQAYQWHDYGPWVYSYCRDILNWLMTTRQTWAWPDPLVDLMGLEYQVVSLYLSLQHGTPIGTSDVGYSQTGMARLYRSRFRLSQWLRDKKTLGLVTPPEGEEQLLITLPDLNSRHKYLLLPVRCAALFNQPPAADMPLDQSDLPHLARLVAANALVLKEESHEVR